MLQDKMNQGGLLQPVGQAAQSQLPSLDVREPVPHFEETLQLQDIIDILVRRKWTIIGVLCITFVTTVVVSLAMTPIFRAEGRLQLEPAPIKVTKFEDVVESQLRTAEYVKTQMELLKSPTLAARVIKKLGLDQNPMFNPMLEDKGEDPSKSASSGGVFSIWKGLLKVFGKGSKKVETLAELEEEEALIREFQDNLDVSNKLETTVVNVRFTSPDPFLASDVVNALLNEFVDWQMDQKIQSAAMARQQLEKQIEEARIKLEKAEENLNAFAKKVGIVSLDSKLNLIYRQLEEINKALAEAQAERINFQARYEQAKNGDVSSLPEVLNSPLIQRLRQDLVEATSEYEKLTPIYKPDYPRLKVLQAKMEDIQAKISAEEQRIFRSIANEYFRALERERQLQEAAQRKKEEALLLNEKATQYKILEREVETNKSIYRSLLERAREIEANVGAEISNIKIVDKAKPPLKPYRPNILLNTLLAIAFGLALGTGAAFLLEHLDNTIKRIEEFTDRFKIPLLGVLPLVSGEEHEILDTIVIKKPKAGFAEAIRTARASIELSAPLEHPPKVFLVTSTTLGEGKTTVSSNLALAFSSAGKRTVIIDADLRRPRLHRIFNSTQKPLKGLSNYLSGGCGIDEILTRTEIKNLYFMPAGPIPPSPAELLASKKMVGTIKKLKEFFDCVILDGPPASGFADVLVLGNMVDGVILVGALGETHREGLRIFRRSMLNVNAHLLGCLVNKLPISQRYGSYSYYKYYRYGYYYQPYGSEDKRLIDPDVLGGDGSEGDGDNKVVKEKA